MTGRILYGYQIEKGIAAVEQTEGVYVQKLFDDYINGIPQYKLLPELIQYAEKKQLPLPTIKASYMKTLLTNPKYMGDSLYPQLISKEVFLKAQEIREKRLKKIGKDDVYTSLADQEKYFLKDMLVCGECGREYKRYKRKIGRKKKAFLWDCAKHISNKSRIDCRNIHVTEEQVSYGFMIILNRLIQNPDILTMPLKKEFIKESTRYKGVDREIKKMESGELEYDQQELLQLVLKRAALKYLNTQENTYDYYTQKLCGRLEQMSSVTKFDEQVFKEFIKKVIVHKENALTYVFKNGKEIRIPIK